MASSVRARARSMPAAPVRFRAESAHRGARAWEGGQVGPEVAPGGRELRRRGAGGATMPMIVVWGVALLVSMLGLVASVNSYRFERAVGREAAALHAVPPDGPF